MHLSFTGVLVSEKYASDHLRRRGKKARSEIIAGEMCRGGDLNWCQSVTSSVNKRATQPLAPVEILSGVEKLEASVY